MQIARVGVHPHKLIRHHRLNARMRVAHMRHVVIGIQIGPPPFIKQMMPPTAQQHHRVVIGKFQIAAEMLTAHPRDLGLIGRLPRHMVIRQVQKCRRIGADRLPQVKLIRVCHAGPIGAHTCQRIGQLKVQMRRPAAVAIRRAEPGKDRARRDLLPLFQCGNAVRVKMAVERVEHVTRRRFMRQNHHAAIVERPGAVLGKCHLGRHWRADRGACGCKDIDTHMHGAAVRRFPRPLAERRCGIDQAWLAVIAQPDVVGAETVRPKGGSFGMGHVKGIARGNHGFD